jgi:hypothetical protein
LFTELIAGPADVNVLGGAFGQFKGGLATQEAKAATASNKKKGDDEWDD